jgi:EAL domain-containing protein (putative c-di-GMP-specific phosphodiesterase class I)
VEDALTLEALREWGCTVAQGYYLSRPLTESVVLTWLRDRKAADSIRERLAIRA